MGLKKKGKDMTRSLFGKSISILMLAMAALLSSCGTTFMVAADDMYGTMPTREQERRQKLQSQWTPTSTDPTGMQYDAYYDETAQNTVADTFNYDDYYDYEYSSRLRRFQSDDYLSNDYYSDYYTNSYWYDANPYYYGTSIYLGYNWWYPSYSYYYRPGWYMGFGYDPFFTYGGWGYRPYRYGWGYGSYSWGYNDGFWDGYWAGRYDRIYDYCYNPYDRNTYTQGYYGRRTRGAGSSMTHPTVTRADSERRLSTTSSVSSTVKPSLPSAPSRRTFAERYENAVSDKTVSSQNSANSLSGVNSGSTGRGDRVQPTVTNRRTATPSGMMESVSTRLEGKTDLGNRLQPVNPGNNNRRGVNPAVGQPASSSSSSSAVPATPVRPSQPAQPGARRTSVSVPSSAQQPSTATSSQPRPYNNPVYERSRGTSSYVSPQYNNRSVRTTPTTPTAPRPATTATPRTTTAPVRSTPSSTTRTSVSPSRSTSSGPSSSGSSTTRRTR